MAATFARAARATTTERSRLGAIAIGAARSRVYSRVPHPTAASGLPHPGRGPRLSAPGVAGPALWPARARLLSSHHGRAVSSQDEPRRYVSTARARRCSVGVGPRSSFWKIAVTCFSTAAAVTQSASAMPFRLALGHRAEHVALARAQRVERTGRPPAPEHPPDHLGVQRAAAGGDAPDRLQERLDVAHAFLEQVAHALGLRADELERVLLLVVLGKHEHAGLRTLLAQLERRAQPVVAMIRRHLHIGDDHVGLVGKRLAQEGLGVAGLPDDLEARLGKQARDPLAHEHVVLAEQHPHGRRHTAKLSDGRWAPLARGQEAFERGGGKIVLGNEGDGARAPDGLGRRGVRVG
jgi:hypothetical protein